MIVRKHTIRERATGRIIAEHAFAAAPAQPPPTPPLPTPRLEPPTLAEMAENFAGALVRWAAAGFALVPEEVYRARLAICRSCYYWDEHARLGYGKCQHPKCGCSKGKQWLKSERCPDQKWV